MENQGPTEELPEKRLFHIHNCLGRGGFGEVYRSTMTSAGGVQTEVAIKVLHNDLDAKSQAVQRLRDEGKLLGILNHPAILRVNDLVCLEGRVALVTEYVEGSDLGECFLTTPPLSLRATIQVIGQISDALYAAYYTLTDNEPLRLVHRDIKPANIRIGKHGDVKLLDFGIARADSVDREAKTQTNTVIGSFCYMAPERFERHETVQPPGDVYSLGCVLYERITGESFYLDIPLRQQYLYALNSTKYLEYMEERFDKIIDVPAPVLALLQRLLSYDPVVRPTAKDLVGICEDLADSLPGIPLRRWCRSIDWTNSVNENAPFSGRVITESTFASRRGHTGYPLDPSFQNNDTGITLATDLDLITDTNEQSPLGNLSKQHLLGTAVIVTTLIIVMFVTIAGGIAVYLATQGVSPLTAEAVKATGEVINPLQDSIQPAPLAKAQKTPDLIQPKQKPEIKPIVSLKQPVQTKAQDTPPPTTPSIKTSWSVSNSTEVELRANGLTFKPGETPPNKYVIWAKFPGGWTKAGQLDLSKGTNVTLECSALKYQCFEKAQ